MASIRGEIAESIARASAAAFIAIGVSAATIFALVYSVVMQVPFDLPGAWWTLQGGVLAWVYKDSVHKPTAPPDNPPIP